MRSVVISAKTGKLWKITTHYIKLCKMQNVNDMQAYNEIVFKITGTFNNEESEVRQTNKQVDLIGFESKLKEILSCEGKK